MKSNYEPLGKHIRLVDYRNSEEVTSTVLGISIDKEFMPSVANVIGTDLSRYKLISKGLFACNPMHVGRDERLPIALYEKDNAAVVSPAYFMFEIIDRDVLNEEYLMMWFRRPEFDRECWFMTDGSVRGGITWDDLCRIKLPVPSYARQCEIVESYRAITNRIALKRAENDNLQQQAAAIFRSWFVDYVPFGGTVPDEWKNVTLEDITTLVSRGITPKYADDTGQIVINQKCIRNHMIELSFARSHRPKVINNKWLQFGDLLINSTGDGTLGRAAQVWFQPHNLTVDSHVTIVRPAAENMIFYIGLWGTQHEKEIESLHTGSTGQTELPRDRVKAIELLLPDKETLERFNALIAPMAAAIVSNQEENNRLASIRDALLPKLMSGKIDVSAIQL